VGAVAQALETIGEKFRNLQKNLKTPPLLKFAPHQVLFGAPFRCLLAPKNLSHCPRDSWTDYIH